MACYRVVGAADCPYFARAERLAQMLRQSHELSEASISVEMIHPKEWATFFRDTCKTLGFGSHYERHSASGKGRALIWNPLTCRVVGGDKEFRAELDARYGVTIDVSWSLLERIAAENLFLFEQRNRPPAAAPTAAGAAAAAVPGAAAGATLTPEQLAAQWEVERAAALARVAAAQKAAPAPSSSSASGSSSDAKSTAAAAVAAAKAASPLSSPSESATVRLGGSSATPAAVTASATPASGDAAAAAYLQMLSPSM